MLTPTSDCRRPRLRDLAELVRAPAALTVPGDVLAGAVAAGNLRPARVAGLAASSVCLYWAGMALNDWADRQVDAVERPDRPIPSGRVSARTALGLAGGLTAAALSLSALAGRGPAIRTTALLAATAWGYDLGGKNTPAGPLLMATARSLDVLVGAGDRRRKAWAPAVAVGAHILGVTAMSRGEVYGSTPLPARGALAATTVITAGTVAGARGVPGLVTAGLAGLFATSVGPAQAAAAQDPTAGRLRAAVGAGIHGLVPLQAAWCARRGSPVIGAALVGALPVARRLARKVSPT
ncbi:SCO3242 family prenyltransferase [Kribbella catacumbae]|uniref:SCO3242 family prenyltransferase n=1 Tax=Kribbella catacumbae TaxID=460086 RepID=UPI000376C75A|nr:UbiA family prenyltransferase [Kribbella catacumbae]